MRHSATVINPTVVASLGHTASEEFSYNWTVNTRSDDMDEKFGFVTSRMNGLGKVPKMIDARVNNQYTGKFLLSYLYPWFEFPIVLNPSSKQWQHEDPLALPSVRQSYVKHATYATLQFIVERVIGVENIFGDVTDKLALSKHSPHEPLPEGLSLEWLLRECPDIECSLLACPPLSLLFFRERYERVLKIYTTSDTIGAFVSMHGDTVDRASKWLDSAPHKLAFAPFTKYEVPELPLVALKKLLLTTPAPQAQMPQIGEKRDRQPEVDGPSGDDPGVDCVDPGVVLLAAHVYQEVLKVDALATFHPTREPYYSLKYYPKQRGHDYTPLATIRALVSPARRWRVEKKWTPALLDRALAYLESNRIIVIDDECYVYLRPIYRWTRGIAEMLVQFARRNSVGTWYPPYEQPHESLNTEQRRVFTRANTAPVIILHGKGGTGKTFTLKHVLSHVPSANVLCTAPTGRAATVVNQMTGYDAFTIHFLLAKAGSKKEFKAGPRCLAMKRVLIVDEMSMVSLELLYKLLELVKYKCPRIERIFFVGDHLQLPPIEGGSTMENLVTTLPPNHRYFALVGLVENKRSNSSVMYHNQDAVLRGRPDLIEWDNDAFFFETVPQTPEEQTERMRRFFEEASDNQEDWHVITAKNTTSNRINNTYYDWFVGRDNALKKCIEPESVRFRQYRAFQMVYPVGIKFSFKQNIDDIGVSNGTIFVVDEYIDPGSVGESTPLHMLHRGTHRPKRKMRIRQARTADKYVEFKVNEFDPRRYGTINAATTVHKFQGSETDVIAYWIHPGDQHVLTDRHVVTAIGRAQKRIYVIAQKEDFEQAVRTPWIPRRSKFTDVLLETETEAAQAASVSSTSAALALDNETRFAQILKNALFDNKP